MLKKILKELKIKAPSSLVPIIKDGLVVIVENESHESCYNGARPGQAQITKQAPIGAVVFMVGNPYGYESMIMGYDNYWPVQYYRRKR